MEIKRRTELPVLVIFCSAVITLCITLITAIFPAFLLVNFGDEPRYPLKLDPYQIGPLAYPLLIIDGAFVLFGILMAKNKLPRFLADAIKFILKFEVSGKVAAITLVVLVVTYIAFSIGEVWQPDKWDDFDRVVKTRLENWNVDKVFKFSGNPLAYLLGVSSMEIFGTYRAVPLISSAAILVLSYFFTVKLTDKKFAGLVAVVFIMGSTTFLTFDTTITYPSFWILFYLLSLYMVYKCWPLSVVMFVLAVASKPLSMFFFPMTAYFVYRAQISKKRKLAIASTYVIITIPGLLLAFANTDFEESFVFNQQEILRGFTSVATLLRFDEIILFLLFPLIVGLYITARNHTNSDMLLVFVLVLLLLAPVIPGFTTYANTQYRMLPLVVFFAVGVGMIFSNSRQVAVQSSRHS